MSSHRSHRRTPWLPLQGWRAVAACLGALSGCTAEAPPTQDAPPAASPDSPALAEDAPLFREVTAEWGLDFVHDPGPAGDYAFPRITGSGCALVDVDADGDLDVFCVQGESGARGGCQLYLQDEPGRLRNATAESGLSDSAGYGMGVAAGDANNDGLPELYVTRVGGDQFWLNLGGGKFQDVTEHVGVRNLRWGASAAWLDFDRDGWLDLVVANYVDYFPGRHCFYADGSEDFCHPAQFEGSPACLFRNTTGALPEDERTAGLRFEDASQTSGLASVPGPGLGVCVGDFNNDGWCDIYLANDAKANTLWLNQAGQSFVESAAVAGVACDVLGRPQASMGTAWADFDNDADFDLLLTHLDGEYNTLYRQFAPGFFEDSSQAVGTAAPSLPHTGFGVAWFDWDCDGDLDLAVANGRVGRPGGGRAQQTASAGGVASTTDSADAFWAIYAEPNLLLANDGQGRLVPAGPGGDFTRSPRVSRGLAAGDIDGDGDLDLLTCEIHGPARLFLNETPRRGAWLELQLSDPRHGPRDAQGAVLEVRAGERRWRRQIASSGSYQSAGPTVCHVGLGEVVGPVDVLVTWPDGTQELFAQLPVDRSHALKAGEGRMP